MSYLRPTDKSSDAAPPLARLLLLLLAAAGGVAALRVPPSGPDGQPLRPIATRSQARRVCAELCLAGLGGRACGADCVDLVPPALPVQSAEGGGESRGGGAGSGMARRAACAVLCENNLGRPLCDCEQDETDAEPDYVQVCAFYCIEYDYRVFGCQNCSLYKATVTNNNANNSDLTLQAVRMPSKPKADYNAWCQQQCQEGNGGVACNCDILPMLKST